MSKEKPMQRLTLDSGYSILVQNGKPPTAFFAYEDQAEPGFLDVLPGDGACLSDIKKLVCFFERCVEERGRGEEETR